MGAFFSYSVFFCFAVPFEQCQVNSGSVFPSRWWWCYIPLTLMAFIAQKAPCCMPTALSATEQKVAWHILPLVVFCCTLMATMAPVTLFALACKSQHQKYDWFHWQHALSPKKLLTDARWRQFSPPTKCLVWWATIDFTNTNLFSSAHACWATLDFTNIRWKATVDFTNIRGGATTVGGAPYSKIPYPYLSIQIYFEVPIPTVSKKRILVPMLKINYIPTVSH